MFWPDLATCHYADTLEELKQLNIKFVPKKEDPPNVPQLPPIEDFWSNLKRKVYANGWTALNTQELVRKIKYGLKHMPHDICQNHLRGLKTKVRIAVDRGVLSVIN